MDRTALANMRKAWIHGHPRYDAISKTVERHRAEMEAAFGQWKEDPREMLQAYKAAEARLRDAQHVLTAMEQQLGEEFDKAIISNM
jgi:hypothetical protein